MKLRLRDNYEQKLNEWLQSLNTVGPENTLNRTYKTFFEPDNTVTFADLEPGQWFTPATVREFPAMKLYPDTPLFTRTQARQNAVFRDGSTAYYGNEVVVIPGTIIDGKFVPDEEWE